MSVGSRRRGDKLIDTPESGVLASCDKSRGTRLDTTQLQLQYPISSGNYARNSVTDKDDDDSYLDSEWANPRGLQKTFQGIDEVDWKPK